MKRRSEIILLLLTFLVSFSYAQTIHKDDIDHFVGAYARTDSLDRANIDCSRFVEWMIIRPEPGERWPDLSMIEFSRDTHWIYSGGAATRQNGELQWNRYRKDLRGFRFYIMLDYWGWERRRNVLTVWKPVGADSLRYYCGQVGEFDSPVGHAWVERVDVFPDSSLLLVVKVSGEGYAKYVFTRGLAPCEFEEFSSRLWTDAQQELVPDGNFINIRYIFEDRISTFEVVEVTEYITLRHGYRQNSLSMDSASVRVIDLWQLARK